MVVFLTTIFALWSGIGDGLAALVIIQSETFAEASRQLVKLVCVAPNGELAADIVSGSLRSLSLTSIASNV